MEEKKLGLKSVISVSVGLVIATSCLVSVGHFLRTVQYMPVCFAPCSCASFPFLEPFLSFSCTLGNTLILQSREHIQHRIPCNS